MNTIKYILTVAANERLMLYRTAKFWILGGIGVIFILFFLVVMTIATFLDSSIPGEFLLEGTDAYLALYFFSYIQVILIVFVAVDFRKLEEKWRLDQVMLSKPMTTANWVVGKYIGVVSSVLYLNIFLLILAAIGKLIKYIFLGAGFNILPFLKYFLIATLPSILFMTALVFLIVSLVRVQALAILLALGYVVAILAYFRHEFFGLVDYGSFFAPIFSSDLIGFGDLHDILLQRTFFLLLTVVLLGGAILLYPRLGQSRISKGMTLGMLSIFLAGTIGLGFKIVNDGKSRKQSLKDDFAYQAQWIDQALCRVTHYDLKIQHDSGGTPLKVTGNLIIENPNDRPLRKLIFSLNGGLEIMDIERRSGRIPYSQNHQMLILELGENVLYPGEQDTILISYAGNVDGDAFALDRLPQKGLLEKSDGPWNQPNTSAWIDERFAMLPSQAGWYPVPGAAGGYPFESPRPSNFATAVLQVETHNGLQVISQGNVEVDTLSASRILVTNNITRPVPGMSLNIGKYERMSHQFDQALVELYYDKEHLLDYDLFADVADTCLAVVERILEVYEDVTGVPYPYQRLSIVEVPLHIQIYTGRFGMEDVLQQPGIVMVDEIRIASARISRQIDRRTKRLRRRGQDDSPDRVKRDVFIEMVLNIFLPEDAWRRDGSYYSPVKNFIHFNLDFTNPTLARAVELQLHEEVDRRVNDIFYPDRRNIGMSTNDEMRQNDSNWIVGRRYDIEIDTLIDALIEYPVSSITPEEHGKLYRAAVDFKTPPILQMLQARIGSERFAEALAGLQNDYLYKKVTIDDFINYFETVTGTKLREFFSEWFEQATMPGYHISKAEAEKIDTGNMRISYQVAVRVQNGEKGDGFVRLVCNTENDRVKRDLELGSYEEKEIQFVVPDEPRSIRVIPYFSRNSGDIRKQISVSNRISRKAPVDTVMTVTSAIDSMSFVVDDQDDGFFTPVSAAQRYLRPPSKGQSWWENNTSLAYGKYYYGWRYKRPGRGEFPARWETNVPKDGDYNLGFYIRTGGSWWGRNISRTFSLQITSADGTFPVEFRPQDTADGWYPLGQYRFEKDRAAVIELSDEGSGYVIADAIRWEFIE